MSTSVEKNAASVVTRDIGHIFPMECVTTIHTKQAAALVSLRCFGVVSTNKKVTSAILMGICQLSKRYSSAFSCRTHLGWILVLDRMILLVSSIAELVAAAIIIVAILADDRYRKYHIDFNICIAVSMLLILHAIVRWILINGAENRIVIADREQNRSLQLRALPQTPVEFELHENSLYEEIGNVGSGYEMPLHESSLRYVSPSELSVRYASVPFAPNPDLSTLAVSDSEPNIPEYLNLVNEEVNDSQYIPMEQQRHTTEDQVNEQVQYKFYENI